jgi:enamine deaminase RidA (YjgF/YER057c/UK114 family)
MPIQHFPPPPGIKSPPLSFAARTGDLLFISGIPGFDENGKLPDGFEAQFAFVITNITRVLDQAGATFRDLVKVNVLLTRASDVATMNKLYAEAFGPAPYPARTTCGAGIARSEDVDRDRRRGVVGEISTLERLRRHGRARPGHLRLLFFEAARRGCPASQTSLRSLRKDRLLWPGMTQVARVWRVTTLRLTYPTSHLFFPLDFRDGFLAADIADGKVDPVAGVHAVQQGGGRRELLFRCAAAARADGTVLGLPDGDGAAEPVDRADGARRRLLRQRDRRHSREHDARQHQLCQFHRNLPIFGASAISQEALVCSAIVLAPFVQNKAGSRGSRNRLQDRLHRIPLPREIGRHDPATPVAGRKMAAVISGRKTDRRRKGGGRADMSPNRAYDLSFISASRAASKSTKSRTLPPPSGCKVLAARL